MQVEEKTFPHACLTGTLKKFLSFIVIQMEKKIHKLLNKQGCENRVDSK